MFDGKFIDLFVFFLLFVVQIYKNAIFNYQSNKFKIAHLLKGNVLDVTKILFEFYLIPNVSHLIFYYFICVRLNRGWSLFKFLL